MRHIALGFVLAVFAVGVLSNPAEANLRVCNKTKHPVTTALGFYDGKSWASSGWWTVPSEGCSDLLAEPLQSRYYYLYAVHQEIGGVWDGDRTFCTRPGNFLIEGRGQCVERGYEHNTFFQID